METLDVLPPVPKRRCLPAITESYSGDYRNYVAVRATVHHPFCVEVGSVAACRSEHGDPRGCKKWITVEVPILCVLYLKQFFPEEIIEIIMNELGEATLSDKLRLAWDCMFNVETAVPEFTDGIFGTSWYQREDFSPVHMFGAGHGLLGRSLSDLSPFWKRSGKVSPLLWGKNICVDEGSTIFFKVRHSNITHEYCLGGMLEVPRNMARSSFHCVGIQPDDFSYIAETGYPQVLSSSLGRARMRRMIMTGRCFVKSFWKNMEPISPVERTYNTGSIFRYDGALRFGPSLHERDIVFAFSRLRPIPIIPLNMDVERVRAEYMTDYEEVEYIC